MRSEGTIKAASQGLDVTVLVVAEDDLKAAVLADDLDLFSGGTHPGVGVPIRACASDLAGLDGLSHGRAQK